MGSSDNVLIASDRSGDSRETPKSVREVAFGVATFSLQPLSDTPLQVAAYWFLGRPGARQTHGSKSGVLGSYQILSRIDEKSNIQIPIDAKYVTRGIAHRGDLEQGRVITQNKIGFHHMLANSLADVVAEEAAKRLLPDLNLERKAKKARGAAGDIYELQPLVVAEETSTRPAVEKVVDELAQQGHLLIRHNRGLKCNACNLYRANRQFSFWNRTPCVPRPCAAEVVSNSETR